MKQELQRKNKELKNRQPRPWGLTALASAYHLQPDPNQKQELKLKLINHVLTHYLTNGMTINNQVYNIHVLAMALNEEPLTLQNHLNTLMLKRGTMFDDGIKGPKMAREMFSTAFFKALEIQALTQHQVAILRQAQGTKYVPFLTGALNQSIGNLNATQRPILDLLGLLTKALPEALMPTDAIATDQAHQYLSPEKAMEIITSSTPSLLEDETLLADKRLELGTLPQVDARYQNLTNIGIRHDGTSLPENPSFSKAELTTGLPHIKPDVALETHTDRRNRNILEVEDEADYKA